MIALAGDFDIFAPRLTARLAAVLLARWNIAEAWNMRAFLVLLVCHINSSKVQTLIADSFLFRRQFDAIGLFGTIAINQACKIIRVDRIR